MNPFLDTSSEFRIPDTPWFLDARFPRSHAIVSHAHSDHIGRHGTVVAHPATCDLLAHRLADPAEATGPNLFEPDAIPEPPRTLIPLPYRERFSDQHVAVELFPAGHVLGSAMPRITTGQGRFLYTGDFRYAAEGNHAFTVTRCQPPDDGADVVLMECTYGLARYRFEPRRLVIEQLLDALAAAQAEGKQPVCLCYSLGKAQEVARILTANGFAVSMHGAAFNISEIYNQHGVDLGPFRKYEPGATEGTVLIAPPHIRNSRMITNLKNPYLAVITGWALDTSAKYRYQADAAFPLSDHSDFTELNAFVDHLHARGTKRFLLTHGFVKEFCRHLRGRGIPASPARPPAQMSLFDD